MKYPPTNRSDEYWKELREAYRYHFEIDYDDDYYSYNYPPSIDKTTLVYVSELEEGNAEFLKGKRFDHSVIDKWIDKTIEKAEKEAQDNYNMHEIDVVDVLETDILVDFPHLFEYNNDSVSIGLYYVEKDMEYFKEQVKAGSSEFAELAGKLEWDEMIHEIPAVKDIFLF